MAIAHLSAKVFSRSQGHNLLSKVAYRAGARLFDARLGKTWNYTRKRHVAGARILAPEGAPAWSRDRQSLWTHADAAERRLDSQLARELEVALPIELSPVQQDALIDRFVREHCVRHGMVADIAIHRPDGNPHAHVMLTLRELTEHGFGRKVRAWNQTAFIERWRAEWELATNRALALAGHQERIEMGSYAARGIDLEPQPKRGRPLANAAEDGRALVAQQTADALRIARRNGQTVIRRPELALADLTRSGDKPTFTPRDVLAFAHRHSTDEEQYRAVVRAIRQCPEVVSLGVDDQGRERLTTRAILESERALLLHCHLLSSRPSHPVTDEAVNEAIARAPHELDLPAALTDEQAAAVRHVTSDAGFALVEGYAGTGKSTMLHAARAAWERAGYAVVGAALAGKAAEGLEEGSGITSRTLAAWQWRWQRGLDRLSPRHVLVVDEAGMIGTRQFEDLVRTARETGAKLVVVGDTRQLQAIDPGAPMRLIRSRVPAATLSSVVRQRQHPWQAEASREFATGDADAALRRYAEAGRVHSCADQGAALDALVDHWQRDRRAAPTETQLMLAYRRADVRALNERARRQRRFAGELGDDRTFETTRGPREFAVGDRLYFLKNDRDLGVKNGSLGTVEHTEGPLLTIRIDGGREVYVDTRVYADLDHGYAGTIHKAQGVTVDRAYVLASTHLDASAAYVAMSRHRKDAQLFYSATEFATPERLIAQLGMYRLEPSAHEAAQTTDPVTADLTRHAVFLESPRDVRLRQLAELERLAASMAPTLEALVESAPEVVDARKTLRKAVQRVSSRASSLEQDDANARDRTDPEFQEAAAAHERATAHLAQAERALNAALRDPGVRTSASQKRRATERAIREAQRELRALRALHIEAERTEKLQGLATRISTGRRAYRVAARSDEGTLFHCVKSERLGDEELLVLRHPGGGPLVLTYANRCAAPSEASRAYQGVPSPARSGRRAPSKNPSRRRSGPSR